MSSQKAPAVNGWAQQRATDPVFILERHLTDTLELQRHVQQVRIRSHGGTTTKTQLLFDGMAGELQTIINLIRNRLACCRTEGPHIVENGSSSYRRLFDADGFEPRELFEALLFGYAHYARQTSEAITSLRRSGDPESAELLAGIFKAVERCLWFLEIYLEGLALNTNGSRLPEWA